MTQLDIFFVYSAFKNVLKTPVLAIFWIQKCATKLTLQILHN